MTATGAEADTAVIERLAASGIVVSRAVGVMPGIPPPPRIAAALPQLLEVRSRLIAAGCAARLQHRRGIGRPSRTTFSPTGSSR